MSYAQFEFVVTLILAVLIVKLFIWANQAPDREEFLNSWKRRFSVLAPKYAEWMQKSHKYAEKEARFEDKYLNLTPIRKGIYWTVAAVILYVVVYTVLN